MTEERNTTAERQKRPSRRRLAVILSIAAVAAALAGYGVMRALDDDCNCAIPVDVVPPGS